MSRRSQHRRERITKRRLRDLSDPLQISDMLFREKYRVNKDLFMYLLEELRVHITPSQRSDAVPFELKLLSSLSFLATGSYQRIVGNECDISLSQSSVSRSHLTIVNALNAIMQKQIQFPCTEHQRNDVKVSFYRKFGVPGVIGCIDGTFVAIIRPKEHEDAYFCRNGYHAINVAIICDCDLKIIGINAAFGGSAHDSDVWHKMFLSGYIQRLYEQGETGWLLGDSGYPQRPWLMTPILHAEEGTPEAHYNDMHTRTRFTVERCIALLKARWRLDQAAFTRFYFSTFEKDSFAMGAAQPHWISEAGRCAMT
ncbi:unnamed protein product [Arctia plantaginis]|uniref:DDE Tnp4 domain-containing protein n=1 Tax=Arctia plantaginis TaxID=874455 RepID=A0A8S1BAW3_ARCPL|nr:unnamed protein product [Arctia plantaginis]